MRLSSSALRVICTHAQNLKYLNFDQDIISSCIHMLGQLSKLKFCSIRRVNSVDAVINTFAKGNVPIEWLLLSGRCLSGENLMSIASLKRMRLNIYNTDVSYNVPQTLLRTQPALENLEFNGKRYKCFRVISLIHMMHMWCFHSIWMSIKTIQRKTLTLVWIIQVELDL